MPEPRAKGQRHLTLAQPGWVDGGTGQGRFAALPLGDDEHGPVVAIVEYAPGTRIGVHHHDSDYCSIVLSGEIEVTRRVEGPGSIRHVRAGTAYGPLAVGDAGCTVLEVFEDRTTFVAPVYLREDDRLRGQLSPMPGLLAQAISTCWPTDG